MRPLNELSAGEAAAAIAAGEISSEALVGACLERVAAREPVTGAWSHLDPEQALAQARARDGAEPAGPLHGVPVAIKDIIDTADMPTGYGSPIYQGHRPAADAACVALLRAAGAVILGKTVTTEFAAFTPGRTANPHDSKRTPGGSSSGSAAAVADFMVPLAYGTQTAGSVIRPASFCGVVGYKASMGMLPLAGVKVLAPSLDTLGAFARRVADLTLLRAALAGAPAVLPPIPAPPRIGLCRTAQWPQAEEATRTALERSAERLAAAGADVAELALPQIFAELPQVQQTIMSFEASRAFAYEQQVHGGKLSPRFREVLAAGRAVSYEQYVKAQTRAEDCRRRLEEVFEDYDVLLAPSAPGEAPMGLEATGDPLFNRMWTLLHVPLVSLPGHTGPAGMPVGVQVVGPFRGDDRLLSIAAWMETRIV